MFFPHQPRRPAEGHSCHLGLSCRGLLPRPPLCLSVGAEESSRGWVWSWQKNSKTQNKPCHLNYPSYSFRDCRMCWRCLSKGQPRCSRAGGTSLLTYLFHLPSAGREGTELAQQPHSLHLCQGLDRNRLEISVSPSAGSVLSLVTMSGNDPCAFTYVNTPLPCPHSATPWALAISVQNKQIEPS